MFHLYAKRFFVSSLCVLAGVSAFAQNVVGENSPYSRFGIGDQRNGVSTLLKEMGSISSAYANPFSLNTDNPASYASLKLTTYEAGIDFSTRTITNNFNEKYTTGMATLGYLNVGIPIGKHAGIAFGLRPNTRVYYNLQDTLPSTSLGKVIYRNKGNGSTNYAFIGASGKYKGLNIGFNFGYLFGTTTAFQDMNIYDTIKSQHSSFETITKLGGIYWKGGVMYEHPFNKKMALRVGGTLTLSQDLNASRDQYWMSVARFNSDITDTVYKQEGVKSKTTLPMSYTAGVQVIGIDKWMLGVDFSGANWSQFRNFGSVDSVTDQAYKIAVGGEYTPNIASLHRYFDRVTYRLGFYYGKDYVTLNNTDINYYAVTAGLSLPFRRSTDRIHTAFEFGSRGTKSNGLSREAFVRFSLGISLNDRWFIKSKYE